MDTHHATTTSAQAGKPKHEHKPALWLQIPSRAVSVVEHPCIIKNIDKGITSLGGAAALSKVGTVPFDYHDTCI